MTDKSAPPHMTCFKCHDHLIEKKVLFTYLNFPFSTTLPRCPSCGQTYLSEDFVEGKLSDVEKTLEDK